MSISAKIKSYLNYFLKCFFKHPEHLCAPSLRQPPFFFAWKNCRREMSPKSRQKSPKKAPTASMQSFLNFSRPKKCLTFFAQWPSKAVTTNGLASAKSWVSKQRDDVFLPFFCHFLYFFVFFFRDPAPASYFFAWSWYGFF